jgi:hypothetical protein
MAMTVTATVRKNMRPGIGPTARDNLSRQLTVRRAVFHFLKSYLKEQQSRPGPTGQKLILLEKPILLRKNTVQDKTSVAENALFMVCPIMEELKTYVKPNNACCCLTE